MTANELALLALDDGMLSEFSLGELADLLTEMAETGELDEFLSDDDD